MKLRRTLMWILASMVAACFVLVDATESYAQPRKTRRGPHLRKPTPEELEEMKAGDKTAGILLFKMTDIDGEQVELKQFSGKVILMVNIASQSEYAQQVTDLQTLYDKYKDQGLVILAFPSNDFQHEPGNTDEIKAFCREKYKATFHVFEKASVKGDSACELYKFLSDKKNSAHGGEIENDFTKFLIDRKGETRARYKASEKPGSKKMTAMIERLLKVRVAGKEGEAAGKKDGEGEKKDENKEEEAGGEKKEKEKTTPNE